MELLDLYDIYKHVTDKQVVRGEPIPKGYYRYVAHVCIFNSEGEMLIQKRAKEKKYWPDLWDFSVGGCVSHGETPQEAISREAKEELGLDIDFKNSRPLFTYSFENGYDDLYIKFIDVDLDKCVLQKEEVATIKWATLDEIKDMLKNGSFINYYTVLIEMIFKMKDSNNMFEHY